MRLLGLPIIVCTILFCSVPVTPLAGPRAPRAKQRAKLKLKSNRNRNSSTTSKTASTCGPAKNINSYQKGKPNDFDIDPESSEEQLCDYTGELSGNVAVTHDMVLEALRNAELPMSASRKSVLPPGTSAVRQACLGLVGSRQPQRSSITVSAPRLTKLLTNYLDGPHGPGASVLQNFAYTSIQLNSNYAAKEHVDFNNLGPSIMIALGNFTGGRLNYGGTQHTVKETWLEFDGRELHSVEPFENERYSIVYFCNGAYAKSVSGELDVIADLGMRVSPLQQTLVSPAEARMGLDSISGEGRVLLVRGLAKGCQTTASRSDLSRFGGQVTRWVAACLEDGGIGTISNDDDATFPRFELRLHSTGNDSRVRAANTCFVVAPSKLDADAAADAFQATSDHRLVVEEYRPPVRD